MEFDLLIVGAGLTGIVIAERAAAKGLTSLLVEKRNHIGGNCYDEYHPSGVLIHKYGPHLFRTNRKDVVDYLSRFTSWIAGNYRVESFTQGQYFPIPINIDTLEKFYGVSLSRDDAKNLLDNLRLSVHEPKNSEEFVLSRVGNELYDAFYLGYTLKQWDRHPRDLAPSVCGRIPVRLNRDWRYVDHKYQMMPEHGFTRMLTNMLSHPNISVLLNTEYKKVGIKPRLMTIYTGPIDEYFNYSLGRLPWRSLNFEFKQYDQEFKQHCLSINYPNDFAYTRSVEIKHITRQKHHATVVSYEYSSAEGDPYYPVPSEESKALHSKYEELALKEPDTVFAGRLATYSYIDMDTTIEQALALASALPELK